MRSLSIVAVALLGTALSTANAQQVKTTHTGPTKGQHSTLKTVNGQTHLPPVLGTRNTNPAKPLVAKNGPSHNSFVSGGSDTCATATPISGPGPFVGDNVGATTDGPANCAGLGSDVWYDYTAGFTGPAIFSLCGSGYDTAISVYDTAACQGPLLGCNDDSCAFQSQLTVPVVNGNVYKVQIGGFVGSQGNYTMSVSAAPTCPCGPDTEGEGAPCGVPSDAFNGGCNSTPVVYSTIACGGSVCGNGAFNGSYRDTDWYHLSLPAGSWQVTWTCTAEFNNVTGILDYNNCPNVNIFDFDFGVACSPTTSTATFNGPTDIVLFAAPDFSQIIACGTNDTYHGDVTCVPVAPPGNCDVLHDGSSENAVGFGAPTGTDIMWIARQGAIGESTVVNSISTAWGTAAFPGNGPPGGVGSIERIGIWQDTDNDGDPSTGLSPVLTPGGVPMSVVVGNVDNDVLDTYALTPPIVIQGTYFIGASSEGAFPSPLDQSVAGGGRSWIVGSTTGAGTIDYNNLNGASFPPFNEDGIAPGVWLLQAGCDAKGAVSEFCAASASCPCGGGSGAPAGCQNHTNVGSHLSQHAGTVASISAVFPAALQLDAVGQNSSTLGVLFQGSQLPGSLVYGDGLRCVGNPLVRVYVLHTITPNMTTPNSPTIAAAGGVTVPGTIKSYFLAYRDPAAYCNPSPATFNASNAVRVVWGP